MSLIRDLFRPPPPRPPSTGSTGAQKSGGGAPAPAPAQNQAQPQGAQPQPQAKPVAPGTATTTAPATTAPATGQPAPAPRAQPQLAFDLFDPRPAASTRSSQASQPSLNLFGGLGDWFKNLGTDLFAQAKHRAPTDRTNWAQYAADRSGKPIPISSNDDDPFAKESNIEGMHRTDFDVDKKGNPVGLHGNRATISEETKIFRMDPATGQYKAFAWNPWPAEVKPDDQGRFVFDEPRFPPHLVERGPDGKVVIKDGLQVWTPNNLKVGSATTFEAMNATSRASESWAGRKLDWGVDGKLDAEPHAFIEFNAFYSGNTKSLFFGVVPYRLPGETQIKLFETATSWEMVSHEAGHAVHATLKPNHDIGDVGYDTWGESFADQTAMWGSLKDRDRAEALLKEIDGNPDKSNSLTRMGEAFAALVGKGTGIRDAYQDLKISNTTPEVHDRSQVLTGASYKVFQHVFDDQVAHGRSRLEALQIAGDVMGTINLRATEHTPENSMSLEDVGKAWLKVDKEYFNGQYGSFIASELERREIFTPQSVPDFQAHEKAIPKLSMGRDWLTGAVHKNDDALNSLVDKNLSKLGIPAGYSLKVQSHELDDNGSQIVHVQLMQGKGKDAVPVGNNGVMVFKPDGSMMDWNGPVPAGATATQLNDVLKAARDAGLDKHGVPVGIRRGEDGQLTARAEQMSGTGLNSSVKTWSLDNPAGVTSSLVEAKHPDLVKAFLPEGAEILTADEIANLKPEDLAGGEQPAPGPVADTTVSPLVAPPAPEPAPEAKVG